MRILLATDAFPPVSGGSGWSTYHLARGLRTRGHDVLIVRPMPGKSSSVVETEYDGFRVIEAGFPAPPLPYVRNYFKNERLYRTLPQILTDILRRERIDIAHGQHVLTCLPSITAARRAGVPAVCTVRDYWPVCYWSDLIHTRDEAALCPRCSAGGMVRCIQPRGGTAWPAALPMIPYMRRNLRRKREGLAGADAVVAVSTTIAADLRARAPELSEVRMEIIPNPVDVADLRARAGRSKRPLPQPYALYLGKLAPNKGTVHLVPTIERAGLDWPLVVAGDGPDRTAVEAAARRAGRDVRFTGWVDQGEATAWLAHASMLVFPSRGPESLSRVLIEASALGIPIAAMNTGGTPDIVEDQSTGLLSATPEELAGDVRRLAADEGLRGRLGAAARERAQRFDAPAVVERMERLYLSLRKDPA
ncbi:MAG: glycosyltransferase family 4 protein [Acidobacteria bacterium]|nr:glycosyltransferase family 4 protein [Acidobacteriota bacterium]